MNEFGLSEISDGSLLGADTTKVEKAIEESFVDAWMVCAKEIPRSWFYGISFKDSEIVPNLGNGTGHVILPDNFYLLSSFMMEGWNKPVYDAELENENILSVQTNEYTRGNVVRPVCTISSEVVGEKSERVLNYYSLPRGLSEHIIEKAIYIPIVTPLTELKDTDKLNVNVQTIEPLAYLTASIVFTLFEKYDLAKSLENQATRLFPGLLTAKGTTIITKQ